MSPGSDRAAVRTPVAPMFAEPRVASAQISQLVAGRRVDRVSFRITVPREAKPTTIKAQLSGSGAEAVPLMLSQTIDA